jgi:putative ABC transport system permease protein
MFKNYLKIAFRNLIRYKGHSFINIAGLAIGMAACLLLFLWVQDELSYDRYNEKAERIYRVVNQIENNGRVERCATIPAPLSPALVNEFPWIQKVVRFARSKFLVKCQGEFFYEDIFFADPDVFDVFTFPLVAGNPETALQDPDSILISEEMKNKYFGEANPVGKTIALSEWRDFKITGVFKNIPQNSHFRCHLLASVLYYRPDYLTNWGVSNFWTYILVLKDSSGVPETFDEKMPQFVEKYRGKKLRDMYNLTYLLQPLTSIHLHSNVRNEIEPNRDIGIVYIFSAIALFILLIACLNYINLATARFTTRAREAGLRKVLGATPNQLIRQFLGESFLLALIALPLAILLAELFLPLFNSLSGKELAFHYFNNPFLLAGLVGIILCVGVISGIVPSLFMSAFQPTAVMKGMLKTSSIIPTLRRSLVVFQFSISIALIICTMIIANQLHHMRTKNLGFNKNHMVNIKINHNEEAILKYETIKHEFLQHPNVIAVSTSSFIPGQERWYNNYWIDGMAPNDYRMIRCITVDYDFIDTFQMNIVEGRGFSKEFTTDADSAFILNEAAVRKFGWESAIDKNFTLSVDWKKGKIIGVVEDFHFHSLHREIQPLVLCIDPASFDYFAVRIKPDNIPQTLDFLKNKWEELVPGEPFDYTFLDEDFDRLYKSEEKLERLFIIVTFLAVFVACLGLFGLAAFTAEQRTKEIGIRKVLGASVPGITLLLSKEFSRWVLISNIIAWPIAWYAMNKWLQNFAYRITILPWTFLLAGLLAFLTALLTVSYKAIRAARANPIETLRYE